MIKIYFIRLHFVKVLNIKPKGIGIIPVIINHKNKFPVGYIIRKIIKLTKNAVRPSLTLLGVTKNL
jgi:hypothetical protein